MAKKSYEVDRTKLVAALRQAEIEGPLKNLDALWKAAETIYNANNPPRQITFSVIALRAKEWNLELKTKPGKRGRGSMTPEQIAAMQAGRGQRVPRAEKFKKFSKEFAAQRAEMPESKRGLIDRAENGSAMAAIAANCFNCSGQSSKEVRLCLVHNCNLYHLRPGAMPYAETLKLVQREEEKEAKEEKETKKDAA
jgi:hypothetical protein